MYIRLLVLAFLLLLCMASCTPIGSVITHNDCDGKFWISEFYVPCYGGRVTIDRTHNIREGVKGELVSIPLVGPESIVEIQGELEDPCKVGSVTYTHPCGQRTVDIERVPVRVTAPARVKMRSNGQFGYKLQVSCCPDVSETHDISITTSQGVRAVPLLRTHTCPGDNEIDVWGMAKNLEIGGSVTVTLTGPESSCTIMTMIDP